MTVAADRQRLYKAVDALCLQAGTDTSETVEWLCGPHGGMAKLFADYFSPDMKSQSFAEKYPPNPDAKCKCEHWQACIDCHPNYIESALKGDV
jgi:hypothetical protein